MPRPFFKFSWFFLATMKIFQSISSLIFSFPSSYSEYSPISDVFLSFPSDFYPVEPKHTVLPSGFLFSTGGFVHVFFVHPHLVRPRKEGCCFCGYRNGIDGDGILGWNARNWNRPWPASPATDLRSATVDPARRPFVPSGYGGWNGNALFRSSSFSALLLFRFDFFFLFFLFFLVFLSF